MSRLLVSAASRTLPLLSRRCYQITTMSNLPSFVDIGVNLCDDMFSGHYHGRQAHPADLDLVLQRAQKAGVIMQMLTVGQINEIKPTLTLTKQFQGLYCTAGIHPTRASQLGKGNSYLDELRSVLDTDAKSLKNESGKIIAIGECGLDYDRLHFSSMEDQLYHFELQLQLAKEYKLPLFLHCRAAHSDFVTILRRHLQEIGQVDSLDQENRDRKRIGVVHCFTGTPQEMTELIEMGFFIGLTGCSLKNQEGIQVAKNVPLDKLLLETDAPWCDMRPTHASAPFWSTFSSVRPDLAHLYQPASAKKEKWDEQKMTKGRNEPCAIGCVAAVIAQVKGVEVDEVASAALNNSRFLLGI